MNTPNYIKTLLMPVASKPQGRKVWSVDLETVWLPFFMATNVMGDTAIPLDALGCPIRLAYAKDGSVRFNQSGRPVTKVAKEVADSVRLVRENFTANLMSYSNAVIAERKEDYSALVKSAIKAGEPILTHDNHELTKAMSQSVADAIGEPEPKPEPEPVADTAPKGKKPELVTV